MKLADRTKPISTRCSNTGHFSSPRWTSPCCYAEMDVEKEGSHACPDCGRSVRCTIDTLPDYVAEIEETEGLDPR